jgi:hypothetical protein
MSGDHQMAFLEVIKAIQWSEQSTPKGVNFPVIAYLTEHIGQPSKEPVESSQQDILLYAFGEVYAVQTPSPHLAGILRSVQSTGSTGGRTMAARPKLSIGIQIFADGTLSISKRIDDTPIGGLPPTGVQGTDVADNLIIATKQNTAWTVGIERMPKAVVPPG